MIGFAFLLIQSVRVRARVRARVRDRVRARVRVCVFVLVCVRVQGIFFSSWHMLQALSAHAPLTPFLYSPSSCCPLGQCR